MKVGLDIVVVIASVVDAVALVVIVFSEVEPSLRVQSQIRQTEQPLNGLYQFLSSPIVPYLIST